MAKIAEAPWAATSLVGTTSLVGPVPGGAAVTHPAKVMLERCLAGLQELGLLRRSAATGMAIPLLASVGWGATHFLSSVTGQAEVPGAEAWGAVWGGQCCLRRS